MFFFLKIHCNYFFQIDCVLNKKIPFRINNGQIIREMFSVTKLGVFF